MATANDIISGALQTITSLQPGEAVDGSEAGAALSVLNAMLGSWSAQSLLPPFRTLESFPLTIGKEKYTIGTGGDFNTERPDEVTFIFTRENGTDTPLNSITREQYYAIGSKTQAGDPACWFYDQQYPLGALYLYPAPAATDALFIESIKPVPQFPTLQSTLVMPGEYVEFIQFQLMRRLAPRYGYDISADANLTDLITESERLIKARNVNPVVASFDAGLGGVYRGAFQITLDD